MIDVIGVTKGKGFKGMELLINNTMIQVMMIPYDFTIFESTM